MGPEAFSKPCVLSESGDTMRREKDSLVHTQENMKEIPEVLEPLGGLETGSQEGGVCGSHL